MRHKYGTTALVVARHPRGESGALVTLLTEDFGLVRARAEGLRRTGAKLASALTTFSECEVILVRGREGWRVTGALLRDHWHAKLPKEARDRVARLTALLLRLVSGETGDPALFTAFKESLTAWCEAGAELHEAVEYRAILTLLARLGLDAGEIPSVREAHEARASYVTRINRGLTASGL